MPCVKRGRSAISTAIECGWLTMTKKQTAKQKLAIYHKFSIIRIIQLGNYFRLTDGFVMKAEN